MGLLYVDIPFPFSLVPPLSFHHLILNSYPFPPPTPAHHLPPPPLITITYSSSPPLSFPIIPFYTLFLFSSSLFSSLFFSPDLQALRLCFAGTRERWNDGMIRKTRFVRSGGGEGRGWGMIKKNDSFFISLIEKFHRALLSFPLRSFRFQDLSQQSHLLLGGFFKLFHNSVCCILLPAHGTCPSSHRKQLTTSEAFLRAELSQFQKERTGKTIATNDWNLL